MIQGDEAPTDLAIDLSALEFVANDWEVLPPGDEHEADGVVKVVLSDELPTLRRWSSFNFREWLRQKF